LAGELGVRPKTCAIMPYVVTQIAERLSRLPVGWEQNWERTVCELGLTERHSPESGTYYWWFEDFYLSATRQDQTVDEISIFLESFPQAQLVEGFHHCVKLVTAALGPPQFKGKPEAWECPFEIPHEGLAWLAGWERPQIVLCIEALESQWMMPGGPLTGAIILLGFSPNREVVNARAPLGQPASSGLTGAAPDRAAGGRVRA